MCSEHDYFIIKIESYPAAAKSVATAFHYSFLNLPTQFHILKLYPNKGVV